MTRADEYALLCETCGYVVDRLPDTGQCPECGRAIASSLPEARPGTPWDQGPSLRSWLKTGRLVMRRPRRTFEQMRLDVRPGELLFYNCLIAACIGAAPFAITAARQLRDASGSSALTMLAIGVVAVPLIQCVLLILSTIERVGIQIVGRAHAWRVTRTVAAAVCELSSYGWVAGAALFTTTFILATSFDDAWQSALGAHSAWRLTLIPASALLGMTVFETLVYIGVRRCKFTNRARPVCGGTRL